MRQWLVAVILERPLEHLSLPRGGISGLAQPLITVGRFGLSALIVSIVYVDDSTEEVDGLIEISARGQHNSELHQFDLRSTANAIPRCTVAV